MSEALDDVMDLPAAPEKADPKNKVAAAPTKENAPAKDKAENPDDDSFEAEDLNGGDEGDSSSSASEDDGVDWGDKKEMKGKGTLDNIVVKEKGRFARFALLPGIKVQRRDIHYVEKKGYAICHSSDDHVADCCEKLGVSQRYYAAIVVHYVDAKSSDGSLNANNLKESEVELKCLRIPHSSFKQISNCAGEDGLDLLNMDFVMTPKSNGKGYDFTMKRAKATWLLVPEMKEAVEKAAKRLVTPAKTLEYKLGKRLTPTQMKEFCGDVSVEEGSMEGMDEV